MTNTATATAPATFATFGVYTARSACDHNTRFMWTVTGRTAKFITVEEFGGKSKRVGVKVDRDGNEYALPFGSYSMAPVIRA